MSLPIDLSPLSPGLVAAFKEHQAAVDALRALPSRMAKFPSLVPLLEELDRKLLRIEELEMSAAVKPLPMDITGERRELSDAFVHQSTTHGRMRRDAARKLARRLNSELHGLESSPKFDLLRDAVRTGDVEMIRVLNICLLGDQESSDLVNAYRARTLKLSGSPAFRALLLPSVDFETASLSFLRARISELDARLLFVAS